MNAPEPVCPADHDHGYDTICYLHHGCRDEECRAGMARRARERRAEIQSGTYVRGRVDAAPVRAHLEWLRDHGLGITQIARETRIPKVVLAGICWGAKDREGRRYVRQRVTARYAHRILVLQPTLDMYADGAKIFATGTRRRIEALGCLGWTHAAIARHCGISDRRVSYVAHSDRVTARLARIIARAYEELWDTAPVPRTNGEQEQVRRTLERAARLGWAPPLAWDDIDNDPSPHDPERSDDVDVIAVELAVRGGARVQLTRTERHEAVRQLHARHLPDGTIAQMLGVAEKTIYLDRKHLELPPAVGADRLPLPHGIAA